jgi:uncharacterized membrane protein YhaH (DUF805 family)
MSMAGSFLANLLPPLRGLLDSRVSLSTIWANLCACLTVFALGGLLSMLVWEESGGIFFIVGFGYLIAIGTVGHVGRLHDCGHSGWWWFLHFIPYAGSLLLWLYVLTSSGDEMQNEHGNKPVQNSANRWPLIAGVSLGLAIIVVQVGGFDEENAIPKNIADYEGLVISEAFKTAHNSDYGDGLLYNYKAGHRGFVADGVVVTDLVFEKNCSINYNITARYIIDQDDSTVGEIFYLLEGEEALDGAGFSAVEIMYSTIYDGDSLDVIQRDVLNRSEFQGSRGTEGVFVEKSGDEDAGYLLPKDTLFFGGLLEAQHALLSKDENSATLVAFDSESDELFQSNTVVVKPILLDDEYRLWEISHDGDTWLTTRNHVEVWNSVMIDGEVESLSIESFELIPSSGCEDAN